MKHLFLATALLGSVAQAQTIDGVVLHTEITTEQLIAGVQSVATHSINEAPALVIDGYLALIDPDYFETPLSLSPVADHVAKYFVSSAVSLEREAIEIAITRAFDQHLDHETILAAELDQAYLGNGCHGIFWASRHSYGHPVAQASLPEQVTLITLAASNHYNPYRDTDVIVAFSPHDLRDPANLNLAFSRVASALQQAGVLSAQQTDHVLNVGPAMQRFGCPNTFDRDRHPNDLTTQELARRAIAPYRTTLPSSAITFDALVADFDITFEASQADDSPVAAAFVAHIWPATPELQALYPDQPALQAEWRQVFGSVFELAPMLMETYPMGLGCTGPSALIAANWETAPDEITFNQQAVIAALLTADDPDALMADSAALKVARDRFLQRELDLGRGDSAQFQAAIDAPLPPLGQSCSE